MNPPDSPNLDTPHSQTRSSTPEERNAKRRALFEARIARAQSIRTAQDARPIAGQGVEVRENMITARAGGGRSGGNLEVIISSNGYAVYATIEGTITGSVPPEP